MKHKPLAEITLRKYEKPYRLSGRELIKKLCLSIGLLQPADSRDVIVDVFSAILNSKNPLMQEEIGSIVALSRKETGLPMTGTTPSNIRRQLKRLRDNYVVEKTGKAYRLAENAPLNEVFSEKIEKFYLPAILSRVKEYCQAVENERCKNGANLPKVQKPDE